MLSNLYAKNLALIENLSVDFSSGFSVMTGETGAGKSLILDSMNLFLHGKTGKEFIRHGEDSLSVSLFFDDIPEDVADRISEICPNFVPSEGITLSRTVSNTQKGVCRINSRQVPFSLLNEVANLLFKINGQNDAIGLQDRKNHIKYLDSVLEADEKAIKDEYSECFSKYQLLLKETEELKRKDTSEEARELIKYRINEIEKAKIKEGEEELLKNKLEEIKSREKIMQAVLTCNRALSGGEKGKGAEYLINVSLSKLEPLSDIKAVSELLPEFRDVASKVESLSYKIAKLSSESDAEKSTELIDKITKRLDVIYRATAKYGPSEEDVLKSLERLKNELDSMSNTEERIKEAEEEKAKIEIKLKKLGDKLSEIRKRIALTLEKEICGSLYFLDMPKTLFKVNFTDSEKFLPDGTDEVEFFISTNAGEGKKPLCEIASGGELSRVMLALQTKFGKAKDVPTIVFDEIDTGISGSTSQKIGIALKELGMNKQIIAVTHSAQVASLADSHFKVKKEEKNGRTQTSVTLLSDDEKIRETARILSGEKITDEAISNSEKLYAQGKELFLEHIKNNK